TGNPLPTRRNSAARVGVQVTVGAGTLLGIDDQPAQLGGYGPIPADLARRLAQDGTWRALFTDTNGHFLALGTKKYRPGADLTRTVIARDVTCCFPGCRQPAVCCDLDHVTGYDKACADKIAQTTQINLQPLCRFHHNLKTNKRWGATRTADGTIIWTSPTRHTYQRPPEPIPGTHTRGNARHRPPSSNSGHGAGGGGPGASGRSGRAGPGGNGTGRGTSTGGGSSGTSPPDPRHNSDDDDPP